MGLPERGRRLDARFVERGAVLDRVRIVVGRVAFGVAHHSPVHRALSTITIAMPAITSIWPSTSGQVTDSPTSTTDAAMPNSGAPPMPSGPLTGGHARATETARAGQAGQ